MTRTQEAYERFDVGANGTEAQQPVAPQPVAQQLVSQPTPVIPSSTQPKRREVYKNRIFAIGIAECILGGLSVIFAIVTVSVDIPNMYYPNFHVALTYISQGIWAGAVIVITGILGVCIRAKPTVEMYNANMSLAIITAVASGVGIILSGLATSASERLDALYALHLLITLCLFGGFISSIVHSAFCCGGLCGGRYKHPGTVVYISQAPHHQQIGGIPSVQYVIPAGTRMPQQGYFVMSPAAVGTNAATIPSQQIVGQQMVANVQTFPNATAGVGQQMVTNVQTAPSTSVPAAAPPAAFIDSPPGYSTLPKQ